jgi:cytochrome c oxidase assembly protein subunit 20
VGAFCFAGIGSYEFCQRKRQLEKVNMKRAVEIMDRKKAENEKKKKEMEAKRKAKEDADAKAPAAKSSWKFW